MDLNTLQLDSRLEVDSSFVSDLTLCQVRLSHNAAIPWILLIPKQANICEIIDLNASNQILLMQEISLASQVMKHLFTPTKLNIASLGNVVPQLHIHIIARYTNDEAWPHPIWNSGVTANYTPTEKIERINLLKEKFLSLALTLLSERI